MRRVWFVSVFDFFYFGKLVFGESDEIHLIDFFTLSTDCEKFPIQTLINK